MSLAATKFVHVGLFLRKKMVAFLFQPAAELLDRVPKRLVIADFGLSFLFAYDFLFLLKNPKDHHGSTPLHLAAIFGCTGQVFNAA